MKIKGEEVPFKINMPSFGAVLILSIVFLAIAGAITWVLLYLKGKVPKADEIVSYDWSGGWKIVIAVFIIIAIMVIIYAIICYIGRNAVSVGLVMLLLQLIMLIIVTYKIEFFSEKAIFIAERIKQLSSMFYILAITIVIAHNENHKDNLKYGVDFYFSVLFVILYALIVAGLYCADILSGEVFIDPIKYLLHHNDVHIWWIAAGGFLNTIAMTYVICILREHAPIRTGTVIFFYQFIVLFACIQEIGIFSEDFISFLENAEKILEIFYIGFLTLESYSKLKYS